MHLRLLLAISCFIGAACIPSQHGVQSIPNPSVTAIFGSSTSTPGALQGRWQVISTIGAPSRRRGYGAVWSGQELLVWGGNLVGVGPQQDQLLGDGARYDPATDQWRALPIAGAPSPRQNPEVAWTGQELLVWGGLASQGAGSSVPAVPLATGSRYDPRQDAWTPMATDGGPPGAWGGAFALSRGLLVWQGVERGGAWYDAAADQWQAISPPTMLSGRADASTCVVQPADATILVWCGGLDPNHLDRTAGPAGARYRLDTHQWIALTSSGGPSPRWAPYSLWTGQEWLLWGGRKPLDRLVPNNALPSVPRDAPAESGAAADISGCLARWFTATVTQVGEQAGAYDGTIALTMLNGGTNQDACRGESPAVTVTAGG